MALKIYDRSLSPGGEAPPQYAKPLEADNDYCAAINVEDHLDIFEVQVALVGI